MVSKPYKKTQSRQSIEYYLFVLLIISNSIEANLDAAGFYTNLEQSKSLYSHFVQTSQGAPTELISSKVREWDGLEGLAKSEFDTTNHGRRYPLETKTGEIGNGLFERANDRMDANSHLFETPNNQIVSGDDLNHQMRGFPVSSDERMDDDNNIRNNIYTIESRFRLGAPYKEYLSHNLAEQACRLDRGCQRKDRLNNTYLSYCTRYKLENLFSNDILMSIMHDSSDECEKILDELIQLDELINQFDQLFKNLLRRYNCHNGYSVKWTCEDCKRSYRDWLCAINLPYYMKGERIKPCISFCERVEQRCPYLHPITKEQYGGQPVFICRDPNIPFVPAITPDIAYSEPTKCYDLCHLSDNITELAIDSLSKYDYNKCPNKNSIAEEVRRDPLYCSLDYQHIQVNRSNHTHQSSGSSLGKSFDGLPNISTPINQATGDEVTHVHNKKLDELREVLIIYKSQPKTHKLGHYSDHGISHNFRSNEVNSIWH